MFATKVEFWVVNDADVFIVDKNGENWLMWDLNTDRMAICRGYQGESEDKFGYVDYKFENVEEFNSKFDAMKEWVRA